MRKIVLLVAAIAGWAEDADAAVPWFAVQAAADARRSDTIGVAARFDSTTALVTFDSAWRTIGASLERRRVTHVDWAAVRRDLRPSAARARSGPELRGIIDAMLRRIGESHFTLMPGQGSGAGVAEPSARSGALGTAGIAVRFVDRHLTIWRLDSAGAAARAGVEPGHVVERIGDLVPPELEAGDSVGMRRLVHLTAAMRALTGEPGTPVRLVVRAPDGSRRTVVFPRDSVRGPVSRFGNLPPLPAGLAVRRLTLGDGRCIGVLAFEYWLPPVMPALDRAVNQLRQCSGIVLDLRGNLGGVAGMMMGVAGHFVTEAHPLGTMRTGGEELRFVANPRRVTDTGASVEPFAGPLAIVVDGLSASTSEMFAAALQSMGRARIFGERTAGQALPATTIRLPNGDVLMHVVADFEAPNGTRIEGIGVAPDEVVPLSRDALRAGRDAPLDSAVRWIERARPAVTRQ